MTCFETNNVKRNEKTFLLGILTFTVTEYFLFVVLALTANSKRLELEIVEWKL